MAQSQSWTVSYEERLNCIPHCTVLQLLSSRFEEVPGSSSQLLEQVPEEHWIEESEYDAYEAREYEYQYEEPLIEGDEDQKAAHLLEMELRDQEYFEEKKPETG